MRPYPERMFVARVVGESGRVWVVDQREKAAVQRRAAPFYGWEEGREDERVWVQRVAAGDLFDDDREHLRRSFEVGQIPEIQASPFILRMLDKAEPWNSYFFSELAEAVLDEEAAANGITAADVEAVRENVCQALQAIHASGNVHCDVQPSNIMRVAGSWKLADLGAAVPIGAAIDARYLGTSAVPAGVQFGSPADPQIDTLGFEAVLGFLAEVRSSHQEGDGS